MRSEASVVSLSKKVPLSFSVIQFDNVPWHIHSNIQIINILDGECDVLYDGETYHAKEGDTFLFNPKTLHSIVATKGETTVLSTLINQDEFGLEDEETNALAFSLNSVLTPNNERIDSIRYLLYSIIKFNTMENINSIYTNRAITYSLFAQLVNDFKINITDSKRKENFDDTITQLLLYIDEHYQDNLSLAFLADHFNYSNAYLSRLFKSTLDKSFIEYYDQIRVTHSLYSLINTNETIEEIAIKNGFENARSYVRAFQNILSCYPSKYRKENSSKSFNTGTGTSLLRKGALDKVIKYYDSYDVRAKREATRDTDVLIDIDSNAKVTPLHNPQTKIVEFGNIHYFSNQDKVKMLEGAQKDIGWEYCAINCVFDDSCNLIHNKEKLGALYNHSFLSRTIELLYNINLKPYFRIVIPHNINKEKILETIKEIIRFCKTSFPYEYVANWIVSVSPDKPITELNLTEYSNFMNIYKELVLLIRGKLKTFFIASPILCKNEFENIINISECLNDITSPDICPDYYQFIYYKKKTKNIIQSNKNDLKEFIANIKENFPYMLDKILVSGINYSSDENLLNDTIYYSSYVCKNIIDNIKSLSSFSLPHLVDNYKSDKDGDIFTGGKGILTYNGIKKAAYNALYLSSKLGKDLLKKGENYIVTKEHNKIIILINNYNHYSSLFAEKAYYSLKNLERYTCFPKSTNIHIKFNISNLDYDEAKIKISEINQNSSSSYDKWISLGAEPTLLEQEISILKNLSDLKFSISRTDVKDKVLSVDFSISPLETKLIEITLL